MVSNVNMPNSFLQIPNLPKEAVVRQMQYYSRDNSGGSGSGPLPEPIRELIFPHVQNHTDDTWEAADTYDPECLVVKAFMNDPLVKHKCRDEREIRKTGR